MKSFIASLIIAVIVVWGSMFFVGEIERFSDTIREDIEETAEALREEDFERAEKLAAEMGEVVDEEKLSLAAILDHTQLDKIESDIAELRGYIECGEKNDAIAKCEVLDVQIRHMPKNYKVKIENIL